jgi:hypothetical protein
MSLGLTPSMACSLVDVWCGGTLVKEQVTESAALLAWGCQAKAASSSTIATAANGMRAFIVILLFDNVELER